MGFLLALKLRFATGSGGKLTESTVFMQLLYPSTQEGRVVAALISLFFSFHDKNDCCSVDGTCKAKRTEIYKIKELTSEQIYRHCL